jgi:hypothetical protein
MLDEQLTEEIDLRDVEAELCRLPDVVAARIVTGDAGRPVEVHVLAQPGKHAKQVVRDVQSVALASFGLELDRRIVSVVQLGPNGSDTPATSITTPATLPRPRVCSIETQTAGSRSNIRVTLAIGDDEAVGFEEGSIAAAARPRIVAGATLDALRQLEPAAEALDLAAAETVRTGADDIALVTLTCVDPPHEQRFVGSAIVYQQADDAVVRAVLDATNRRLPFFARLRGQT